MSNNLKTKKSGFALLMTLIVVGVILSVGLSILDLSIKQVKLSTNAKDSEIAFHAANAGMECSRYWRRREADAMENGQQISPVCFAVSPDAGANVTAGSVTSAGQGQAFQYEYEFTWGGVNDQRCTQINTIVASSTIGGTGMTIPNMTTLIPGYDGDDPKPCAAGERCTVISVRGYNRPCATATGYGTVQREVLLQF